MHSVKNLFVLLMNFLLLGCTGIPGENTSGYLTKEQMLKDDPEADYFELNDKVYVTGIDWIEVQVVYWLKKNRSGIAIFHMIQNGSFLSLNK